MGGHALKKVVASRLDEKTFKQIRRQAFEAVEFDFYCKVNIEAPEKTSYGDVDILYRPSAKHDIKTILAETKIDFPEMVSNGNCLSVAWPGEEKGKFYQVDFIACQNVECAQFYFSCGDLGALLGRMTAKQGIKFGFDGLWVPWFQPDKPTQHCFDVFLTSDPQEICAFMGLNFQKWKARFKTREAVFNWCIESTFFTPSIFEPSALNYDHRCRLQKRPMYQGFVEYIESHKYIEYNEALDHKGTSRMTKLDAIKHFGKTEEFQAKLADLGRREMIQKKFNGKMFLERGIDGPKIPGFIQKFKAAVSDFDKFVLVSPTELIQAELDLFIALENHIDEVD